VGAAVEVTCERLGTGGVGVCLWGTSQLVLLVKGALPGEQLTAVITAVKKSEYGVANIVSISCSCCTMVARGHVGNWA
jgi:tRNA/tmRNA/rRNA uracil-C5-methylase (TrmA/RlmC/RlmD family)